MFSWHAFRLALIGLSLLGLSLLLPVRVLIAAEEQPEQIEVFTSGQNGYHTFRIPAVIVSAKGTLLAFCEGRKEGRGDSGNIDMVLRRSSDGGRTWDDLRIIWDDGPHTIGNPCPVVDRETGRIWLPLTRNLGQDTQSEILARTSEGTRECWITSSDDDGKTWAKPINITAQVKAPEWTWIATGPGVGIQLRSGRLVIPCDAYDDGGKKLTEGKPKQLSYVMFSDDHGATWKRSQAVGTAFNECQVVERADGSLLLNMRSYLGKNRRAISISEDAGLTWSEPQSDEALIESVCQASLLRYPALAADDPPRLLFSNPASTRREKMAVRLSTDDGRTWSAVRELHAGPAAYSCLTVLPDGQIGCLFERGEKQPYETITWTRFPLGWLTRGTD